MKWPWSGDEPKSGDTVLCDGEFCRIREFATRYASETGEPVKMARYESAAKRHYGKVADLAWDEELGAWYLWGRCLSQEQVVQVIRWRDAGLVVARDTRQRGMPPAGGEHLNLFLALFHKEFLPLNERIADYERRFAKKLTRGFADPDAADSTGEDA